MRIGCSTITFGPLSLATALDHIARLGFAVIDVAAVPRFFEHVQLSSPPPGEAERVAALVGRHGFAVAGLQSVPWVPDAIDDPDELRRRHTVAADTAAALGARAWVVDANRPAPADAGGRQAGLERFRRTIDMAAGLAADRGLTLGVEAPHRGTLAETLPEVVELLDVAGIPGLGIDLDTSHVFTCGASLAEVMGTLGERIVHVALRDARGDEGFCTPGDGDVDFGEFFRLLAATGYAGDATLELESGDVSAEDRAKEAARARDYLEPLVAAAGLA